MDNVNHSNYFKKAEEIKEEVVAEKPKPVLKAPVKEVIVEKPKVEHKIFRKKKFK